MTEIEALTAQRDALRIDLEQAAKVAEQLRAERDGLGACAKTLAEMAERQRTELAATEQLLAATQAERAADVERAMERIEELEIYRNALAASFKQSLAHVEIVVAERDAAVSEAKALRALVEKFVAVKTRHWTHNEECSRSEECEDSDATHPCTRHDEPPCPRCECGMSVLFAYDAEARRLLKVTP